MDKKTLTIAAIITVLISLGEFGYMSRQPDFTVGAAVSFVAFVFVITWGIVALVRRFAPRRRTA